MNFSFSHIRPDYWTEIVPIFNIRRYILLLCFMHSKYYTTFYNVICWCRCAYTFFCFQKMMLLVCIRIYEYTYTCRCRCHLVMWIGIVKLQTTANTFDIFIFVYSKFYLIFFFFLLSSFMIVLCAVFPLLFPISFHCSVIYENYTHACSVHMFSEDEIKLKYQIVRQTQENCCSNFVKLYVVCNKY